MLKFFLLHSSCILAAKINISLINNISNTAGLKNLIQQNSIGFFNQGFSLTFVSLNLQRSCMKFYWELGCEDTPLPCINFD